MRSRFRSSFALRLLAAGVALSLILVVGIGAFLLISREQQTRTAAITNSGNRARVIGQLFEKIGTPTLQLGAKSVASQMNQIIAQSTTADQLQNIMKAVEKQIVGAGIGAFGEYSVLVDANGTYGPEGKVVPGSDSLALKGALAGTAKLYGLELFRDAKGLHAVYDAGDTVYDQ
ncbi:MAG TPA: hypothetical protein VGE42_11415, partial [Candidatus Dormibacteraeota bacterium]